MTRYAFIGNCQIQSIFNLYRKYAEPQLGDVFRYIRSYKDIGEADRAFIAQAEIIVEQVQDFRPKGDIAGIEASGRRIFVPVVNAGFLWPYAGQPHPLNKGAWFIEVGPYGSEASDAFLNRMINRKVPPDEAVARYRDTDVNRTMNLDRLLELSLDKQRARDEVTGFAISDVISAHFRDEAIFRTPYHPNVRVTKALATQFFERMGVSAADTARMQEAMIITPFPKEELPLHPSVIQHFGLRYADDKTTYRFLLEGSYTFEEYARRYMRYEWNAALHEGIALSRTNDTESALKLLREGLETSPHAAQGHATVGNLLHRRGEHEGAIAALQQSLTIDPTNAHVQSSLAGVFNHLHKRDEAEAAMRAAMLLDPYEAHFPTLLAHWLRAWGRPGEAGILAEQALTIAPYAPAGHVERGHAYDLAGDTRSAESCFRRAVELAPQNIGPLSALAALLSRLEQWQEASQLWQQVVELQPDHAHWQGHLVHALRKAGDLSGAIAKIEAGLVKAPRDVSLLSRYAACLSEDGRPGDAVIVLRTATLVEPTNARLCQQLVRLCREGGDMAGAEAALRQMMVIDAQDPSPVTQLAHLLTSQRHWSEARAAAETALAMGGDPSELHIVLANVHQENGDMAAAAASLERAAARAPRNGDLLYRLSKTWEKLGRPQDAVAAARAAVAVNPENPHWQTNLGHMLFVIGAFDEAESAMRMAVTLNPKGAGFHSALADLLFHRGDTVAAVAAAKEAVALAPDHAHFRNRLEYMQQHMTSARQPAAAVPVVAPSGPQTVRDMVAAARGLSQAGDPAAALDLLVQAAELAPQDGDVQYNLSHVFSALDRPADALTAAERAVALQPDNPHWLVRHGLLLMNDAALDEAETKIRTAIAKAPNHAGFHDALARLLGRQGLLDAAITAAREASALEPCNSHFLEHLSRLLESAGDTEGALAALDRAHQAAPDNAHLRTLLIRMRDKYALPPSQPIMA